MAKHQEDPDERGTIVQVWVCDDCRKAFPTGGQVTPLHTAETSHESFHLETFIGNYIGGNRLVIVKKPE